MKTRFVVLVVVVLSLSLAAGALAASWPPSSLAFQWPSQHSGDNYTVLSVKPTASVKMKVTVKFYQLHGYTFDADQQIGYPVTGTGYIHLNNVGIQVFRFNLVGTTYPSFFQYQGALFPDILAGDMVVRRCADTWQTGVNIQIKMVSPSDLTLD